MHEPTLHGVGNIDGTITCACGWRKYLTYPNRGWGRKSVGIRRTPGFTKRDYITNKLAMAYARHENGVTA